MTRYVIDAETALRLLESGPPPAGEHQLVAPASMRSQALQLLHTRFLEGELDRSGVRRLLDGLASQKVRLLADRVSRAVAWQVAADQGWADVRPAEYIAVTRLQADALIAEDAELRRLADGLVPLARFADLGVA